MTDYPRESKLEKFIKDFARKRTAEKIDLTLRENFISIGEIRKRKSILLAKFWANVFQNGDNYPTTTHNYRKSIDDDLLKLKVDKIEIIIDMKTGELQLKGEFVYDWFDKNFWKILENADPDFAKNWTYEPSHVTTVAVSNEEGPLNDYTTGLEIHSL